MAAYHFIPGLRDYRERGWLDPNWKEARDYYMGDGPHKPKYDNIGLYAIEIEYADQIIQPWCLMRGLC
jgi:hypothetical protein